MDDGIFYEFWVQKVRELIAIPGLDFVENWMHDPFRNMRWCFVWLHLTSFMYLLAWRGRSLTWHNAATYISSSLLLWWLHDLGQGQWMVISHQPHQARRSWDLGRWEYMNIYGSILVVIESSKQRTRFTSNTHACLLRSGGCIMVRQSTMGEHRTAQAACAPFAGCSAGSIRWNALWQQSVSNGFWVSHVDLVSY